MASMDYQLAKDIRKKSFADLMAEHITSGGSIGGSLKKTISQKLKAKATGIKEKFDPMNIAKWMTGGSNLAPAMIGRLFGRSERDMRYFTGKTRPARGKSTKIDRLESDNNLGDILDKIYGFLKSSQEYDTKRRERDANFRESQQLEDERRHKDLLKALGSAKAEPTAAPVKEEGKSWIDRIVDMFQNFIKEMQPLFDFMKELYGTFKKVGLNLVMRLFGLLGNPMFLAVAAGAATIWALRELLFKLAEVTPDFTQLTPSEAQAALTSEAEIRKQAQTRHKKQDVSAEEIAETKKYLESRVLHGKETAEQISKMEEGEEKDKAVREFGGKQTIEKTLADNTKYELPTAAQVDKEVIPPRPEAGQGAYGHLKPGQSTPKLKLAQEGWDKKYGNMKPAESTTQTPAPASLPNAGQKVSAVTTENQKLSIEEKLQQSVEKTVNNSSVSSMNTSPPSKNPIPSVRNKEETFDRVNFFLIRPI